MSAFIYLYCDRIVYHTPQTIFSKPASHHSVTWYTVHSDPPVPYDEMVQKGNYSYSLQQGFYITEESLPEAWGKRDLIVQQLQILGAFNTLANTQKLQYTDNSLGQPLTDILMLEEIREYRKTNSLENCAMLTSLLETTELALSPESLVAKMELRYLSYRAVIAYLNRLEFKIRAFLRDGDIEKASALLNGEYEKIGM